jgi:hypothetical protein
MNTQETIQDEQGYNFGSPVMVEVASILAGYIDSPVENLQEFYVVDNRGKILL